jgi:hypothetical protein
MKLTLALGWDKAKLRVLPGVYYMFLIHSKQLKKQSISRYHYSKNLIGGSGQEGHSKSA